MAKPEYKYEIKEILGVASPQEDPTTNWAKCVLKTILNEKEEGIDIRRCNPTDFIMSRSGIRLTKEEASNVCDILLENGYGSMEVIERAYNKRKELYSDSSS